ncbi:MAG: SCO family protein [Desulfurococcales archaeon]|nr:SCO family protein [Desulfurococcales archaeon]
MPSNLRSTVIVASTILVFLIIISSIYVYKSFINGGEEGNKIEKYGSVLSYDPPIQFQRIQVNSSEGPIEFPLRGKLNIVTPQYLGCPDICPLESLMMKYVMNKLIQDGLEDQVVFVTVDVDPEEDTVPSVTNYMKAQAGDLLENGITWIWIVDSKDRMSTVWDELSIYVEKDEETGLVTHTGGFYIISPDGELLYFVSPSSSGWEKPDKFAPLLYDTILDALERTGGG